MAMIAKETGVLCHDGPAVRFLEERQPDVGDDTRPFEIGHNVGFARFDPVGAIEVVVAVVLVILDPNIGPHPHTAAFFPSGEAGEAALGKGERRGRGGDQPGGDADGEGNVSGKMRLHDGLLPG